MKIFDSSNPLWTPTAAGAVVSFVPNLQGAAHPSLVLAGSAHITVYNLTAKDKNVINPAYSTLTLAGVVATDTCVVNGVTYTCVASGATGNQFNIGASDTLTAANLAALIATNLKLGVGAIFQVSHSSVEVELSVSGTSGSCSVTGALEVSLNGVDFMTHPQLAAATVTGTSSAFTLSAQIQGYPFIRSNLTALSGTGAVALMLLNSLNY